MDNRDASWAKQVVEALESADQAGDGYELRMEKHARLQTLILLDIREQIYYGDERFHAFKNDILNYPISVNINEDRSRRR